MKQPRHEFWQNDEMIQYFADKPADPVIVKRLERMGTSAGKQALDLGCGGGRHSELLANMGYAVAAVDYNPEMIEFTKKRLETARYEIETAEMAIEELELTAGTFDVVVCTGVLHQVRSLEDYQNALHRVSNVLKVGGLFTMNVFTNDVWDPTYTVPDPGEPFTVRTNEGLYQTLLSADEIIGLAAQAGLELEEVVALDFRNENTGPRAVMRAHFLRTSL